MRQAQIFSSDIAYCKAWHCILSLIVRIDDVYEVNKFYNLSCQQIWWLIPIDTTILYTCSVGSFSVLVDI